MIFRWHRREARIFGKLLLAFMTLPGMATATRAAPWAPTRECDVKPRGDVGLLPAARQALESGGIGHRITRTLDADPSPKNYHGTDVTIDGHAYTSAVDLSVRCMNDDGIRQLLAELARLGFAAWYRQDGKDGWTGANHVHAVWASKPLKHQLQGQVCSWLNGRTGLKGDGVYHFWQPSPEQRAAIKATNQKS